MLVTPVLCLACLARCLDDHAHAGGRITGQLVKAVIRASGSKLPVSLTSYAVVGAAAYMGGATRMTLTTTVMVMETTGALQLIVPIMITVFVAKVCLVRKSVFFLMTYFGGNKWETN